MAKNAIQVRVEYVGRKPFAVDNVSGSGKCWNGPGDVQVVTEDQAEALAKYPDQWVVVGEAGDDTKVNESAVDALKKLGADPKTETPAADVAEAAAAAAASAKRGSSPKKAEAKKGAGKKAAAPAEPAATEKAAGGEDASFKD